MAQAAEHGGHDPDRVSFTAALRIARQVPELVSPPVRPTPPRLATFRTRPGPPAPATPKRKYTKWHVTGRPARPALRIIPRAYCG